MSLVKSWKAMLQLRRCIPLVITTSSTPQAPAKHPSTTETGPDRTRPTIPIRQTPERDQGRTTPFVLTHDGTRVARFCEATSDCTCRMTMSTTVRNSPTVRLKSHRGIKSSVEDTKMYQAFLGHHHEASSTTCVWRCGSRPASLRPC